MAQNTVPVLYRLCEYIDALNNNKDRNNCQKNFITSRRTIYYHQSKKEITLEVEDARINF
jgi:hypothetical protein